MARDEKKKIEAFAEKANARSRYSVYGTWWAHRDKGTPLPDEYFWDIAKPENADLAYAYLDQCLIRFHEELSKEYKALLDLSLEDTLTKKNEYIEPFSVRHIRAGSLHDFGLAKSPERMRDDTQRLRPSDIERIFAQRRAFGKFNLLLKTKRVAPYAFMEWTSPPTSNQASGMVFWLYKGQEIVKYVEERFNLTLIEKMVIYADLEETCE